MEENKEGSNLPVEVKNKGLLGKPPVIKTIDAIRRAGKLLGATAVGITGLGVIALGSGPVVALGAAVSLGGIARLAQNAHMKTEPTLLFGTKRLNSGALGIFQDPLNMNLMTRMVGYNNNEKMNMMGVQTLVGLARCKSVLANSKYELDENGNKIYNQKFSTVTHGINLSSIEYLEKLGYIKLDSIEADFKPDSIDEWVTSRKKDENGEIKSNLIVEQLGFGNLSGIKRIAKSAVTGEKDKNDKKYVMKKATFRLTDKPIDFDELVNYATPSERAKLPKEQRAAAGWFGKMLKSVEKKNVEIVKDATGRPILKYPSRMENLKLIKRNFQEKQEQKNFDKAKMEKLSASKNVIEQQKEEFEAGLKEGVTQPVVPQVNQNAVEEPVVEKDAELTK